MSDYKAGFEGVGKLRDIQVKLHVDPEVRRTPFSLRDKVKKVKNL